MRLTADTVRELLDYNPLTGELTWRLRPMKYFKTPVDQRKWNNRNAYKPALTSINPKTGNRYGFVLGEIQTARRVVWLWMTGAWPHGVVSHVNDKRDDLTWKYLRDWSKSWVSIRASPVKNKYGVRGVTRDKAGRYVVRVGGKFHGAYDSLNKARQHRRKINQALATQE